MAISPLLLPVVAIFVLAAALVLYTAICLLQNYRAALRIGLPIRIIPICHINPIWMLLDRRVLSIVRSLPFSDNNFTRYNYRGWEMDDRLRTHQELGDAFVMVSPGRIWLYIANPDTLTDIFRRRLDFPRCIELTEILNVFGPNMSTVDGAEWKVQRKLTATCFNDQVNKIVWSEAAYQAEGMLDYWTSRPSVETVAADTRTVSLNILSRAGFGKSFKFEGHEEKKGETGLTSNYKEALQTILENCIFIMALGPEFFAKPWLPKSMRALHEACSTFQQYMTTLYEEEKKAFAEGRTTEKNLVNSLVRASEDQTKTGEGLTEKQIYGNIFVFNFAGHDTTAHTFCFAIFFLAAHPEVQDWVHEEISHVLGSRPTSEWDYEADFPRLKRCLALMLETLRLYTPVPVSKWTGKQSPSLNIGSKTVVLPPRTMVIPSYAAVHVQPQYWGADSLVWRPSRFIQRSPNVSTATKPGEENITPIQPGTFLGWSEGARDCPGRKFSQVEFVATMATLFREWTVEPVLLQGETPGQARRRVLDLIHNESQPVLLLQMLHPEKAPLVWKRRGLNS